MEKGGWVYIMANRYRGGMYVGVTADALARAVSQQKRHNDQPREGYVHALDGAGHIQHSFNESMSSVFSS